jgi:nucleoid-associated protein YgaU
MGLFDFVKEAGKMIGIGDDELDADKLKLAVKEAGLDDSGIEVNVDGDKAIVTGHVSSQEEMEKMVLAIGNNKGVASVESLIEVESSQPEAVFYTVKSGDTLSRIAKTQYGNAGKYPVIFIANKPMLGDPDKIYPGQVLRIPPLG